MINQKHMKHLSFLLALLLSFSAFTLMAQEEEYGLASYYSDDFQGRSTAYGETYDKDQLTCAHKRYPYGTMLRVTRLDTKKSVTINPKYELIKSNIVMDHLLIFINTDDTLEQSKSHLKMALPLPLYIMMFPLYILCWPWNFFIIACNDLDPHCGKHCGNPMYDSVLIKFGWR